MFKLKFHKASAVIATTALFSLATIQSAFAAPGTLATAPLFLSAIVEPNVYFTLDDSGSMDYEIVSEDVDDLIANGFPNALTGLGYTNGLPEDDDGQRMGYLHPTWNQLYGRTILPPSHEDDDDDPTPYDKYWVFRTHDGNRLYYNPAITYTPWPGSDANGDPLYTDADPTAVLKDPNVPGGQKVNLLVDINGPQFAPYPTYLPVYYIWNDDGDGVLEHTDGYTRVEIPRDANDPQMKNFANWFQYYRSRINTTKAAIGAVINNTDASRMGLTLFNEGQLKTLKSMSDTTNKREMLEAFYGHIIKRRGTPGRQSMRDVGEMFRQTGASAPILPAADGGECQQNFNIYMSDGFWSSGNVSGVGNQDSANGANNTIFDGPATGPGASNDGGNYEDGFSETLADVAMKYYEIDLRGDLADNVPTQAGVDEAPHQHLVQFTIAFGIAGTLDPLLNDPESIDPNIWPTTGWPQPVAGDSTTVDDMWHAGYNARGNYLNAQNPVELETALGAAISDIAERTATAAAVSINSAKLTTQSVVYLAQFNTNRWQGDIQAFKIADLNTGELSTTPEWTAQAELNARTSAGYPGPNPRVILTHNGNNGIPFQWASLTAAQRDDLRTNPAGGTDSDAVAQARLEYLRGNRVNEGTGLSFRERVSILGDIVHAGPVFVGQPDLNWPDKAPFPSAPGQRYSDFKNGPAANRDGVVYTGSNYGMLHGFAEADGEEVVAYVPNVLFSTNANDGLHYLTDPNYLHKYYVDLTPTLSDIYADLGSGNQWQTVLIGGLRGGGRGLFALNVNDPAQFSETNAAKVALWEFTNADDPDLGHTFSRPVIGLANNGRWVAVFGNGYNDTGDGEAKLFIVDIEGGADGSWDAGDIVEITTNSGIPGNRNGMSSPALADLDGNGTIDRVYSGDLFGQMWAFDLSDASSTNWGLADAKPLFTTIGNEPITSKPSLSKHPTISDDGSNAPNVMVFFGSGQYLTNADKTNVDLNYFYGVWDRGDYDRDAPTHLVQQTYENGFTDPNGNPARVLSQNVVNYAGGEYGWYFELPDSGERVVETSVVRGGLVFFNTFAPLSDPCSVGGYGYRMAVDIINGGSPDDPSFDVNNDGVIDDNDKASNNITTAVVAGIRQEGYLPEPVFIEDIAYTAETPTKVVKLKEIPRGRFSWQELVQ